MVTGKLPRYAPVVAKSWTVPVDKLKNRTSYSAPMSCPGAPAEGGLPVNRLRSTSRDRKPPKSEGAITVDSSIWTCSSPPDPLPRTTVRSTTPPSPAGSRITLGNGTSGCGSTEAGGPACAARGSLPHSVGRGPVPGPTEVAAATPIG